MKKHLIIALAASALAGLTSTANAWTSIGTWNTNNVRMRASGVSFPSGSSYRSALNVIRSRFYNNPSNFWFTQTYDDGSLGFGNGQNEVWFSSSSQYNPAVTFTRRHWLFGHLTEADIVFWNGVPYTTSMNKTSLWPYGGSRRPFQTTAMHEYGHAAGLGHENDEYNIMGQDWDHIHLNGSTARSYVGEDACDGLVSKYSRASGGSFEDVSVAHWKWSGRSGEYSTHAPTQMFTTSNGLLSSSSFSGQRRYNVNRGSNYRVEFSYENNGETTRTVRAGFYISTNNYISTGDRFIGYANMTLGRNSVWTTRHTINIPSNLNRGQTYYLGVIVDYNNVLAEVDSSNNAAYQVIRIN